MTTRSAGTWATAPPMMRRYNRDAMLASCARYHIAGSSVLDPNTVPRRLDLVVMAAYELDEDGAHLLAAEGVAAVLQVEAVLAWTQADFCGYPVFDARFVVNGGPVNKLGGSSAVTIREMLEMQHLIVAISAVCVHPQSISTK